MTKKKRVNLGGLNFMSLYNLAVLFGLLDPAGVLSVTMQDHLADVLYTGVNLFWLLGEYFLNHLFVMLMFSFCSIHSHANLLAIVGSRVEKSTLMIAAW